MDDSPKSAAPQTNIDDLVKELSRPQNPPLGATNPVPSAPKSSPITPPAIPPVPTVPKEYQSSIRTMTDDLSKLKAGQQPQGVNIPRKIDPTVPPVPIKPAPTTPPSVPAKPSPSSTLTPDIKSAPLAPVNPIPKITPPSAIPRPAQPPISTMPPTVKTPETKSDQKNQFYVPSANTSPSSGSGRNVLFISIAVGAVLLGGLYWYFMIRGSTTEQIVESPIETFTPRPTVTPNLNVFATIFPIRGGTIVLPPSGDPTSAFSNAISAQPNITAGTFTAVDISNGATSTSAQLYNISGLLDRFVVSYPPEFKSALGQNFRILLYGQKESFDTKGRPVTNATAGSRLVLASEIASSSASIFQNWEASMSTSLAGVMTITPTKNTGPFLSTTYNGVSVRFKNFPYPDHSIDHALLQYNGKTYVIFAGSREAMFAVIDAFAVPGK